MDDKCIMENLLLTEKGVCDLYVHGTIESSTANVNQTLLPNQATQPCRPPAQPRR